MVHPSAKALNDRRIGAGVSVRGLLREAGVSYSTWWAWMNGLSSPNTRTIDRCDKALSDLAPEGQTQ